jgi:hypothetical protein
MVFERAYKKYKYIVWTLVQGGGLPIPTIWKHVAFKNKEVYIPPLEKC